MLHGNRGYFHADKQPLFSTTFRIIQEYRLGDDLYHNFLMALESALADSAVVQSNCGKVSDKLLLKSRELFKEVEYYYNTRWWTHFCVWERESVSVCVFDWNIFKKMNFYKILLFECDDGI